LRKAREFGSSDSNKILPSNAANSKTALAHNNNQEPSKYHYPHSILPPRLSPWRFPVQRTRSMPQWITLMLQWITLML
jgi:hypothetical protein